MLYQASVLQFQKKIHMQVQEARHSLGLMLVRVALLFALKDVQICFTFFISKHDNCSE